MSSAWKVCAAIALTVVGGARLCVAGDGRLLLDQAEARPAPAARPAASAASSPMIGGGGGQVLEIPLPERFRGCWQGVAALDSLRPLSDKFPTSKWLPKTYRLCFVEHGLGVWQLTYGENHIDADSGGGFEKEQSVEFLRIEGSTAVLRARIVLGSRPTGKYTTREVTMLRCELADGPGASMRVSGDLVADVDDEPWREATWHADFARVREQ